MRRAIPLTTSAMRPDQHKQKRSAQYKKKHGIKNQDASRTKEKTGKASGDVEPGTAEADASIPAVTKEAEKNFSRRKLQSNWDRYNDISDASDEETGRNAASAKKRGEDFTTLVEQAANPESQFRFRAEQEWEDTGNEDVQVVTSSALQIDFAELATCLQSVPLHQRLDIEDTQIHPDILGQFQNGAGILPEAALSANITTDSGEQHVRIPTPKSTPQKDSELVEETALRGVCVEAPGTGPTKHDKTLVQKDAGLHSSLKEVFKTTSTVQESNKREPKTLESVKESTNPTMKQEDDELDFLLSVSTPAEHSQAQGNVSAQQAKIPSHITSKQSTHAHQIEKGHSMKESLPAKEEPEEDLEDWLDSVLG